MFCIFAYASAGDLEFERTVPLVAHGEFLAANGIENGINVFFMLGYKTLSHAYLWRLEELGYVVSDVERNVQPLLTRFPEIARLPTYYANNCLRWVLPIELLQSGRLKLPFVCVDGDMTFLANISDIERDIAGKTFVLQGCPCFVAIADPEWFYTFERELTRYCRMPDRFNASAAAMLLKPARDDREYCNARLYPIPLRHEQDMQEYLIAAGILPQARSSEIFGNSPYYWVQNPLMMGEWADEQGVDPNDRTVTELNGIPTVAGKRIPFIHFQNDFAWYAHSWMRLSRLGLGSVAPILRSRTKTGESPFHVRIAGRLLRDLDPQTQSYSRANVYRSSLARNSASGNMYVTDIMNTCW